MKKQFLAEAATALIIYFMATAMALTLVMALSTSAHAASRADAYRMDINVASLSRTLGLSAHQRDEVGQISDYFSEQMRIAGHAKGERQQKMLRQAVYGNYKLMKQALTAEQFRRYNQVLNVTLRNRGLEPVFYGDRAER